jgi:hypothetical protein
MSAMAYLLRRTTTAAVRGGGLSTTHSICRRSMSMFLWRHVPVYRKKTATQKKRSSRGWRLNVHQTKPAVPVRVEGIRTSGAATKLFTMAVITPDGAVHPFKGKHGVEFLDFWNMWREIYKQQRDYEDARGIPREVYCPRCDEKMHWLRRAPAKYVYTEVKAKRSLYSKVNVEALRAMTAKDDDDYSSDSDDDIDPDDRGEEVTAIGNVNQDEDEDDQSDNDEIVERVQVPSGPLEDRYCCPNDECGIREARVEFKHNCANVVVLDGLTDKQWKPNKFSGGRKAKEKSLRAKAALAKKPFLDRGYSIDKLKTKYYEGMPYLNGVTHDEAVAIVETKARQRYEKSLKGELPRFHNRPHWFVARNGFRFTKETVKEKKLTGKVHCDECNESVDATPSACFSCGFLLCSKCRHKHFPLTKQGMFFPRGECPNCRRKASNALDMLNKKNLKMFEKLIECNPRDHRRKYWQDYLYRARATCLAFGKEEKVKLSPLLDLMLSTDHNTHGEDSQSNDATSESDKASAEGV